MMGKPIWSIIFILFIGFLLEYSNSNRLNLINQTLLGNIEKLLNY